MLDKKFFTYSLRMSYLKILYLLKMYINISYVYCQKEGILVNRNAKGLFGFQITSLNALHY